MVSKDEYGRPQVPIDGDEAATLLGYLDYQRATLEWKCRGLDTAGLNTKVAASDITLGGLLKHMALVEDQWFSWWLGYDYHPRWAAVDWDADPDWEWRTAAEDPPEELFEMWREAVEASRSHVTEAIADGGLGLPGKRKWPDGRSPNLRWIIVHMIEEYPRHNGHADLIRESIDGETGE